MGEKKPNLFGDMDDDTSIDAIHRKENALGEQIDWQSMRSVKWDGPFSRQLSGIRMKHMAPGDYDGLDDGFDPDGFDEFDGGF